ncbi:MAG TPA: hypothetical protein VIK55_08480 [Paludibacter sp.]
MKSYIRILFAISFCLVICQINAVAQNGASTQSGKVSSMVPARPLAPGVKNAMSAIRAFTGLTKAAFEAKMKSMGFAEAKDEIGMPGQAYKSKSEDYMLAVKYGTRGTGEFVREIYRGTLYKSPNLATVKATFLDFGKQCTDLKAKYSGGFIKELNDNGRPMNLHSQEERTSKFLPAFDRMISTQDDGGAVDGYAEKDYDYIITYRYTKAYASALIIIHVVDKTLVNK